MRSGDNKSKLTSTFKRWLKSDAGSTPMMLTMAAIPLCIAMGLAVDTARLTGEQTSFHGAVDAAVIAIAADTRSRNSDTATINTLKTYAQKYLEANYLPSNSNATNVVVSKLTIVGETVTLEATAQFPTAFGNFVGVKTVNLVSESEAKRAGEGGVELTLIMDTTGSMGQNASGNNDTYANSKIAAAKAAATTLLDTIYGGTVTAQNYKPNIRVSLVPFAAAVRLNRNAYDFNLGWIDTNGSNPLSAGVDKRGSPTVTTNFDKYAAWNGNWDGCVEARALNISPSTPRFNESDDPVTGSNTEFPAYYNFDSSDHSSNCTTAAIVPLTYDRNKIDAGVSSMSAAGNTVIPEGLAWGWRTISPGEPFTKVEPKSGQSATTGKLISPYRDSYWRKVVVLMTDGDNALNTQTHNKSTSTVYSAYGYSNEPNMDLNRFGVQTADSGTAQSKLDTSVINICTSMKAQGVEVYVTGFGTGISGTSLNNLKNCATDSNHYTNATTNSALQAFFQQIGTAINNNALYVSR